MTKAHAHRRRRPRKRRWAAAVTVATSAALVGIIGATDASHHEAPDADAGSTTVPTSTTSATPSAVAGPRRASRPGAAATAAPPGRPMGRSAPTRLRIPAIGVDSGLMELGLQGDGSLEVPPDAAPAGWFTGAPTPGEEGPAIIAGHVRWDGTPGVFEHLADLEVADEVEIERQDGSTAVFRVTGVEHFVKSDFPTEDVYGNIPRPGLRLITCGGLDPETNDYEENVVVFAVLVS